MYTGGAPGTQKLFYQPMKFSGGFLIANIRRTESANCRRFSRQFRFTCSKSEMSATEEKRAVLPLNKRPLRLFQLTRITRYTARLDCFGPSCYTDWDFTVHTLPVNPSLPSKYQVGLGKQLIKSAASSSISIPGRSFAPVKAANAAPRPPAAPAPATYGYQYQFGPLPKKRAGQFRDRGVSAPPAVPLLRAKGKSGAVGPQSGLSTSHATVISSVNFCFGISTLWILEKLTGKGTICVPFWSKTESQVLLPCLIRDHLALPQYQAKAF